MNSKLLIITISGLAAISGLFLFSPSGAPSNDGAIKSQSASIIENVATTTSPLKKATPKAKIVPSITPTIQGSPLYSSPTPTPIVTPPPIYLPTLTPTPTPTLVPSPTPNSPPTGGPDQSTKININTADKQELEKITGVGPVIAQRIIDYRQSNGPFQTIEEIKEVNGIGDIKFEKMKNEITI